MASASLHLLPSLSKFWSSVSPLSQFHTHPFASTTSLRFTNTNFLTKPLSLRFALTDSNIPNSTQPDPKTLLQEISVSHSFLFVFQITISKLKILFFLLYLKISQFTCSCGFALQDSFDLPADYFAQFPNDLRLDVSVVQSFDPCSLK
jgi:hypothetical protein